MNSFSDPLVIWHRVNTIKGLKKVDPKYGVEIDIRHNPNTGKLYLSHDPGKGDDFDAYMKQFKKQGNRFIIFNIKDSGIEQLVIDTSNDLCIEDYFLLDVEFPFIYRAAIAGKVSGIGKRIAVRYSESEPVEQALYLAGKCGWVWIDVNTKLPLNNEIYKSLISAGYKLCLVCPDCWGRPQDIQKYISLLKKEGIMLDAVMTEKNRASEWVKSGVLKPFYFGKE